MTLLSQRAYNQETLAAAECEEPWPNNSTTSFNELSSVDATTNEYSDQQCKTIASDDNMTEDVPVNTEVKMMNQSQMMDSHEFSCCFFS